MPTFAELKTKVERRVIDIPATISLEVADLVNQAMRELQTKHDYKVMEALLEATTDLDGDPTNLLVAKPSNWKEHDGAPYLQHQYSRSKNLTVTGSRKWAERRYGVDPELALGEPCCILEDVPSSIMNATAFYCYPFPDGCSDWSDGEYRIVIPYFKYLPALSADADENWFTTNADEYIVNRATGEAFMLNEDENRATIWLQRAETAKKMLEDADAAQRLMGMDSLPFRTQANE